MEDLVSIVLPIYNGEKYTRESIESVIAQTYQNWELLILDDCSTDRTQEIALEYVGKDRRISYYRNEENLRLPRNLNRGFSLAKGAYLTWTSDDNLYYPQAIQKMVDTLKNEHTNFVYASCDVIDENGAIVEEIAVTQESPKRLLGTDSVGACFLYTREVYETIGDYDPDMVLVEDYDYWLRINAKFKSSTISEKMYGYRRHGESLTGTEGRAKIAEACERAILKNCPPLETLDKASLYYLYDGLNRCRENMGDMHNNYQKMFHKYRRWYLWNVLYPRRIHQYGILGAARRVLQKIVRR